MLHWINEAGSSHISTFLTPSTYPLSLLLILLMAVGVAGVVPAPIGQEVGGTFWTNRHSFAGKTFSVNLVSFAHNLMKVNTVHSCVMALRSDVVLPSLPSDDCRDLMTWRRSFSFSSRVQQLWATHIVRITCINLCICKLRLMFLL